MLEGTVAKHFAVFYFNKATLVRIYQQLVIRSCLKLHLWMRGSKFPGREGKIGELPKVNLCCIFF